MERLYSIYLNRRVLVMKKLKLVSLDQNLALNSDATEKLYLISETLQ